MSDDNEEEVQPTVNETNKDREARRRVMQQTLDLLKVTLETSEKQLDEQKELLRATLYPKPKKDKSGGFLSKLLGNTFSKIGSKVEDLVKIVPGATSAIDVVSDTLKQQKAERIKRIDDNYKKQEQELERLHEEKIKSDKELFDNLEKVLSENNEQSDCCIERCPVQQGSDDTIAEEQLAIERQRLELENQNQEEEKINRKLNQGMFSKLTGGIKSLALMAKGAFASILAGIGTMVTTLFGLLIPVVILLATFLGVYHLGKLIYNLFSVQIGNLMDFIMPKIISAIEWLSDTMSKVWDWISTTFQALLDDFPGTISRVIESATQFLANLGSDIINGIQPFFKNLWESITKLPEKIGEFIKGIGGSIVELITPSWWSSDDEADTITGGKEDSERVANIEAEKTKEIIEASKEASQQNNQNIQSNTQVNNVDKSITTQGVGIGTRNNSGAKGSRR